MVQVSGLPQRDRLHGSSRTDCRFGQTQVPDDMADGAGASDCRNLNQDPLGLLLFARYVAHHDILTQSERRSLLVRLRFQHAEE